MTLFWTHRGHRYPGIRHLVCPGMLEETKPEEFDILVRLSGFSHGTDVWLGNARDLILSRYRYRWTGNGCRDDIMIYLISCGMPEKRAFKIMEAVRKGQGASGRGGGGDEGGRRRTGTWLLQENRLSVPQGPCSGLRYDGLSYRLVQSPRAFGLYAAYFSIRAKAFDATVMCMGLDRAKAKMAEIRPKTKPPL